MLSKLRIRSTAVRLSFGLVALTLSVISVAQVLGIFPDTTQTIIDGRMALCKAIGVHCAAAVQHGVDIDNLNAVCSSTVVQNQDVWSVGIRGPDGQLLIQSGEHEELWKDAPPDGSTSDHVRVPIIRDGQLWGTIEICFEPLYGGGILSWFRHPVIGTMLFVGLVGFLFYIFYLRRTLKILNPQAVIPQRIQAMLNTLAEGLVVLDGRQQIVLVNEAFAAMVGDKAESLQGKPLAKLPWQHAGVADDGQEDTDDDSDRAWPWELAIKDSKTMIGLPLKMTTPGKGLRTLMVNTAPILGGDGSTRGALATFDDITAVEKKNVQLNELVNMLKQSRDQVSKQNEELKWLATRDPLTGCFNRRSLFEQFDSLWRMAQERDKNLGCVMFDIDRFKSVNDTHGHAIGDQVLREVAEVLLSTADEMDVVARYGGEEFCVLIRHGDIEKAAELAERLRQAIEARHCAGLDITSSFGASAKSMGAASTKELLEQADQALYAAKRGGRNRVVRWDQIPDEAEIPDEPPTEHAPAVTDSQDTLFIPYQAVKGLVAALSQRDAATGQHSKRVADLCILVAKDLVAPVDCFLLEVAALLHDLGKLGIPDSILLKPGKLTEDEYQVMQLHDELGVSIVNATFGCAELTQIVGSHHAWYAGHPKRTDLPSGTDIPYSARILTIADAFDAMVSDRPYRKGCADNVAFAELRNCAGKQFDPELVERFIEVVSAHRADHSTDVVVSAEQLAISLDQAIQQLIHMLDSQDVTSLPTAVGALKMAAGRRGLSAVVQMAEQLEQVSRTDGDLAEISELTRQLIDQCRASSSEPDPQSPAHDATDTEDGNGDTRHQDS